MYERLEGYTKEQIERFEETWRKMSKKIEISDVEGPSRVGPPHLADTPRFPPAIWPVPKELFQKNLEKYVKLALDMGAVDAKVIPAKDIPQDFRIFFTQCASPKCRWLNTNHFCPKVMSFPFEQAVEFVKEYEYAVAYKVLPPPSDIVPDVGTIDLDVYFYSPQGRVKPDKAMLARNIARLRILAEMENRLFRAAYYDGHILAAPISAGPCLLTKCAELRRCPALEKGKHCRFVDVEPVGSGTLYFDYHILGQSLGWGELQAGGNCTFPEEISNPEGYYNIGLILIE